MDALRQNARKLAAYGRDRSLGTLVGFLGLAYGVAAVGGVATGESVDGWYRTIRKPSWNPPDWVFGPVWTVLYTMIGIAAWLVRRRAVTTPRQRPAARLALAAWGVQLALNLAWSLVFFGQRSIGGGLGVIACLCGAVGACMALMARVSPVAAGLLAPYLAWTTFATAINLQVWRLNR